MATIKSMDFAMQASFSESFNYTAAEHMYFKVPVIISRNSPLAQGMLDNDMRFLVVDDFTNLSQISNILCELINNEDKRKFLGGKSHEYIKSYNDIATRNMINTIDKFMSE